MEEDRHGQRQRQQQRYATTVGDSSKASSGGKFRPVDPEESGDEGDEGSSRS